MSFKNIVVLTTSTVCAIILLVSVSTTYFSYETITSVTIETSGHLEALSVCGMFKLNYNQLLQNSRSLQLSDIVDFADFNASDMNSLKFYLTPLVCFRLLAKDFPMKTQAEPFSWKLRTSPSINSTLFVPWIVVIMQSPHEIASRQRNVEKLSSYLVSYTRIKHLPGITCTNIHNRYEHSREACVKSRVLEECPNNSKVSNITFQNDQSARLYHQNCSAIANDYRFGSCFRFKE